jgi:sporulation protein YlmC with PRC-barrel domain
MNEINTGGGPISVSKIVDATVVQKSGVTNDHGENLGKIDSVMLDLETGKLAYAVLTFGGFPNRTKLFPVPWELLDFSHHDKKIILNIPRELAEKSPGYDSVEQVVQSADFTWLGEAYEYYKYKAEWEQKLKEERDAEVSRAQHQRDEARYVKPAPPPESNP